MLDEVTISVFGLFRPKLVMVGSLRVQNRGGRLWTGDGWSPSVALRGGGTVEIPGRISRRFPGLVRAEAVGEEVRILVTLAIETAVGAAVAAEMGRVPVEAEKAQAVLSRSYYAVSPRHAPEFDFCDTTHCQVLKDVPERHESVMATRGMLLSYRQHFFPPMFFRSCGGKTRTPSGVGLPDGPYPYEEVECKACAKEPVTWTARLDRAEALLLNPHSENARLELGRRLGWNVVRSNDYAIRDGSVIEGRGEGHGIGLCQRGAIAMATTGHDFASILRHYYPGASLVR